MMNNDIFNMDTGAGKKTSATRQSRIERVSTKDIAIIGMSGKFPMAADLQVFWDNLLRGKDSVGQFPANRMAEVNSYLTAAGMPTLSPEQFREKGFLESIDKFDNKFFGISYKEACLMNPAHRIFLEVVWHAIQDAALSSAKLKGTRTGVYVGFTERNEGYYNLVKEMEPELTSMAHPGNVASILASRISYLLDLKGPAVLVDTACSSSLVAIHTACQALRNGEIDMAVAGGVTLSWLPVKAPEGSGIGIASKGSRARTFDDLADGTVGGEGVAAIMLKPYNTALRDGDHVIALIKGSAINQDGRSIGITAPSVHAQVDVIDKAWQNAGIDPLTISYMEAHGTATNLGDPIEIEAITQAFRKYTRKKQFCAIGAVKTNVGHLDAAAGMAGIIKASLALKHRKLPPTVHFGRPNRRISFETSPVYVNDTLQDWTTEQQTPRRCGVSSFGISGTNCHVILEEAPIVEAPALKPTTPLLACFSAKNEQDLLVVAQQTLTALKAMDTYRVEDVCYTLNAGRDHLQYRFALEIDSREMLERKLENICQKGLPVAAAMKIEKAQATEAAALLLEEWTKQPSAGLITELGSLYISGAEVDWQVFYTGSRHLSMGLPGYPFEPKRCWITYPEKVTNSTFMDTPKQQPAAQSVATGKDRVMSQLRQVIAGVFELTPEEISTTATFLEMGLDSVSIIQVKQLVRSKYNIDISIDTLFNDASTLDALSLYISRQLPPEPVIADIPAAVSVVTAAATAPVTAVSVANKSALETIVEQQLKIMADQLKMLTPGAALPVAEPVVTASPVAVAKPITAPVPVKEKQQQQTTFQWTSTAFQDFNARQRKNLDDFITAFNQKTAASKQHVQQYRAGFANNRNTAHYNKTLKELSYPIIMKSAKGARLHDLDGNEYIDMSMGFGVNLLGYNHPVIEKAIREYAGNFFLGPMSDLPGEVAELVHELTGVDRVAFYNSGTEAVMVALRLARAVTGKNKVVMFAGSYHGTFDGVLAQRDMFSGNYNAVPKGAGIPQNMLEDVLLLDYGTDTAMQVIREHAHELAAVLVEPVQSRRPEFQPVAFLQELRALTAEKGVALIFDEIISGFRIHPGGCQHKFGIQADLVTYGKISGGGLPLGIVAGKAAFMHGVDGGGNWQYGDDSHPVFDHRKTFVAGTFCHHPLTMAASRAMLTYLKEQGPALQEILNNRMAALAAELNAFFSQQGLPISIVNFGSLFQIRSSLELSLFFYYLAYKGIYVWEGMTLFISPAHSNEDIATFVKAIKDTVAEMQEKGFLVSNGQPAITVPSIPLTNEQKRLWFKVTANAQANDAFIARRSFDLEEAVNIPALKEAVSQLVARHEVLQTIRMDGEYLYLQPGLAPEIATDLATATQPFNLAGGPLFRVAAQTQADGSTRVLFTIHTIIADGWSLNILANELSQLYIAAASNTTISLPAAPSFRQYVEWMQAQHISPAAKEAAAYWQSQLKETVSAPALPAVTATTSAQDSGAGWVWVLTRQHTDAVKKCAQENGISLFMMMLGTFECLLYRLSGQARMVVGIPASGQLLMELPGMVGQCNQILPYIHEVTSSQSFRSFLQDVKQAWLTCYKYQRFSCLDLLQDDNAEDRFPDMKIVFNMDPALRNVEVEDIQDDTISEKAGENKYDFFLNVIETGGLLRLHFQFNKNYYPEKIVRAWIDSFNALLYAAVQNPDKTIAELPVTAFQAPAVPVNTPAAQPRLSLHTLLEQKAASLQEKVALSYNGNTYTYQYINHIAGCFAGYLQRKGFGKGQTVAVQTTGIFETLLVVLAVLKAGSIYTLHATEQDDVLAISDELFLKWLARQKPGMNNYLNTDLSDTAAAKKAAGVQFSHRHLVDYLTELNRKTIAASVNEGYEVITEGIEPNIWTDIILAGWLSGHHVKVYQQYDNAINTGNIFLDKRSWAQNILLNDRVALEDESSLFIIATTPLTDQHIRRWEYKAVDGTQAAYFYAPAGAPQLLSLSEISDVDTTTTGVWPVKQPLNGIHYFIQDAAGNVLPHGVYGNLLVQLADTYWYSGIAARLLGEGEIGIDSFAQQNTDGNMYLSEMIQLYTGIADVRTSDTAGSAYLITDQFDAATLPQLMQYLHDAGVPEQYQPSRYGTVSPLALNAAGGFETTAVKSLSVAGVGTLNADPVEEKVIALFRRLFTSRKFFTIDDNFFALGGNSISGIKLLSWIYKEWGIKLDIATLFESPAVKQLAALIRKSSYGAFTRIERLPEAEDYEVSHAQKRLWILNQNENESLAYNMSSTYVLQDGFDKTAFEKALLTLVARHEILRTTLIDKDGDLRQRVHAPGTLPVGLVVTDLRQDPDREKRAMEIAIQERNTTFDFENGPLLRARLLEVEDNRSIFIFTLHHIVSDGWSKEILTSEVLNLYHAYTQHQPVDLPVLPVQYKDYAAWQNAQIGQGEAATARNYWLKKFSGDLPVLELPADYPRPSVRSQNGANSAVLLDGDTVQRIVSLANQQECTLFTFLFATIKVLLYKYSGQEDIIIGLPVSGRDHPDIEKLVGLFVHTLPIRTTFKGADNFGSFLQNVKQQMMDAYRHQVYPVDQLVEDLKVSWEISRRPLFDVIVNWPDIDNGIVKEGEEDILPAHDYSVARHNSMFDLSFSFTQMPENGLELNINFNTDIYAAASVQRMLEHFVQLLQSILKDTTQAVDKLTYLSAADTTTLLDFSGEGKLTVPQPDLVSLFESVVQRYGKQPALQHNDQVLSYKQLNTLANQLADYLVQEYGVLPGDRIGIMAERDTWMVAAVLAVLKTGAAYIPIDPEYAPDRVAYMIKDSGINVLISGAGTPEQLSADIKVLDLSAFSKKAKQYNGDNRPYKPGTDALAYIVYTSGSTGNPKGVMIGHKELLGLWSSLEKGYNLDTFDVRVLQVASFSFDVFFGDMLRSIFRGGVMTICPSAVYFDLPAFYELISNSKVNLLESTPGLLLPLLDYVYEEGKDISFLKILIMGSDVLSVEDYRKVHERFGHTGLRIINSYGTTETTIDSGFYEGLGTDLRPIGYVPVGRPLENTRMYVLDKHLQLCGIGITGELCIGGVGVGRGYWGRPDLTKQRYTENPFAAGERLYRTGDLARWTAAGNLEFLGRGDNQVKIRGYRIELGEVESVLQSYSGVREAVVLAEELKGSGRQLVSYIVWQEEADEQGLKDWMRRKLPVYMHPSYYMTMERLPLTANGKVDRKQLPLPEVVSTNVYEAPRDEVEAKLVKIWEEILQREGIGINDNFFDLGGHSLKGIRVLWRIRKELGVEISFSDIFKYSRIADLATLVANARVVSAASTQLQQLEQQPRYALSHGQLRMWILGQMEESRTAYNMCMSFELRDTVDEQALEKAFQQLITRHEILRTVFVNDEEGVWQQVLTPESFGFKITKEDIIGLDLAQQQQRLAELSASEVHYCFDLSRGPLLRAHLLQMKEQFNVLLINMHHIISDGWSIEVMMEELTNVYEGLVSGTPVVLEPLRTQYKDYAAQQNKLLNGPEITTYRDYWMDQFSGEIPVLNMPVDNTRPAVRSYKGASVRGVLNRQDTRLLQGMVQRQPDKSMFMVLLACTYALLYRYTGQEDIVLGVLVAGREHDDLLDQIGLYVNTLALRTRFNGNESFDNLLENVQDGLLGAFEHQVYPFDLLLEDLNVTGDRSRSPLFDILITYKKEEYDEAVVVRTDGKKEEEVHMNDLQREDSNISKFDMTISFREEKGGIYLSINYRTDIFAEQRMQQMLGHLQEMMRSISHGTDKPVSAMQYLTAGERTLLLEQMNDTDADYPHNKTIQTLVEEAVARTPEQIAVLHEDTSITYDELNRSANRLAHYLMKKHGIGAGKIVGVLVERSEKMIICLLAILKTGAAYVPIDPEYPEERINYIIADSKPDVILRDNDLDPVILWSDKYSDANPDVQTDTSDLAYLIYTSGSTGRPKGVSLMHRNAVSFIDWCQQEFKDDTFETVFALTSYCFDLSIFEMFYTLSVGKKVLVLKSVVDMQQYIERVPDVLLNTVPSVIDSLIKLGANFSNVKLINMAGEPIPSATKVFFKGSGIIIRNLYGPSEDTTYSTCYKFTDEDDRILIGKPISNTKVYIVDANKDLVPQGLPGELCISGAGLARGYLNQEKLTAERFVANPFEPGERMYRTGDVARWTYDGYIDYLGRNDDQVKIRGYRIELGEIQQVMVSHDSVREGVILAVPLEGGEKELVAYIVWAAGEEDATLQRYMKEKLPIYMQPAHFITLEKMPLNSNGKIDKKALPVPKPVVAIIAPVAVNASPVQKELIAIWEEILQRKGIGLSDNFFEIGGHSLKGMRVLARINAAFSTRFTLKDIFRKPTVALQAAAIEESRPAVLTVEKEEINNHEEIII